jgi:CDGSH-type Zn-finger protein
MDKPEIPQKKPYVMETEKGKYAWCSCGKSNKQPFCDGSHKGTGFRPVRVEIEEKKQYAWCGCKHTNTPPFCDGTHKTLD